MAQRLEPGNIVTFYLAGAVWSGLRRALGGNRRTAKGRVKRINRYKGVLVEPLAGGDAHWVPFGMSSERGAVEYGALDLFRDVPISRALPGATQKPDR